jgi:hypothetical protein
LPYTDVMEPNCSNPNWMQLSARLGEHDGMTP